MRQEITLSTIVKKWTTLETFVRDKHSSLLRQNATYVGEKSLSRRPQFWTGDRRCNSHDGGRGWVRRCCRIGVDGSASSRRRPFGQQTFGRHFVDATVTPSWGERVSLRTLSTKCLSAKLFSTKRRVAALVATTAEASSRQMPPTDDESRFFYVLISASLPNGGPGNTNGGSITVPLTSCLTCLV